MSKKIIRGFTGPKNNSFRVLVFDSLFLVLSIRSDVKLASKINRTTQ